MKVFWMSIGLFFSGILNVFATPLTAHSVENNTEDHSMPIQTTETQTTMDSENLWGLSTEEWSRYQQLMQGSDGLWYRQLTPAAVLGIHASTSVEQEHFAEIVAREEHERIVRELAFDQAVNHALHRLYADEPMIKPFDVTPFNPQNRKLP